MAFDKKGFLAKIAKNRPEELESSKKAKKRDLNPIQVLRLALHEPETFEEAFCEAVKYALKD